MSETAQIFVAPLVDVLETLEPTFRLLNVRGKLPAEYKISRISPTDFAAITDLHRSVLDIADSEVQLRLEGRSSVANS